MQERATRVYQRAKELFKGGRVDWRPASTPEGAGGNRDEVSERRRKTQCREDCPPLLGLLACQRSALGRPVGQQELQEPSALVGGEFCRRDAGRDFITGPAQSDQDQREAGSEGGIRALGYQGMSPRTDPLPVFRLSLLNRAQDGKGVLRGFARQGLHRGQEEAAENPLGHVLGRGDVIEQAAAGQDRPLLEIGFVFLVKDLLQEERLRFLLLQGTD